MTEKLYTLQEAKLMLENERLEQEINRLNSFIAIRDAKCGRLNLTIDETVTAWENRVIEKDNEISKLNAWISELIKAGQNLRYQSGLPHENQYIQEWSDLVFRIKND